MNSNPKSSLEFTGAQLDRFPGETLLEVLEEKTSDDHSAKYVLIKHDYYSSDSEHGRILLSDFLDALTDTAPKTLIIYLVDSATKMLDVNNPFYEQIFALIQRSEMVIADTDSIVSYDVNFEENPKLETRTFRSIAEDLICLPGLLTIE